MKSPLSLKLRDSALDPDGTTQVILHRRPVSAKMDHYRVFLFLEGNDLPLVEEASYELHPTFRQRVHRVQRALSNPRCKLEIWTWGVFTVRAKVMLKDRTVYELVHELTYDKDFDRSDVSFEQA